MKDGVLQKDVQEATRITNQQVFEILRSRKVYNLAKVKRMYLEAYGIFSVYSEEAEKAGLPIYPQIDKTVYESYETISHNEKACCNCGTVQAAATPTCNNCGSDKWVKAIT